MPYPPFPLSFLPEGAKNQLEKFKNYQKYNPYITGPRQSFEAYDNEYYEVFDGINPPQTPANQGQANRLKIPGTEIFDAGILEGMSNQLNEPIDAGMFSSTTSPKAENPAVTTAPVNKAVYKVERPFWSWQTQMGNYGNTGNAGEDPGRKKRVGDAGEDPDDNGDDGDFTGSNADYDGDITKYRSRVKGDGDMSYVEPPKKFGTPEAYYLGKSMLDATALINNMVQPEPPSIQLKNTYFERQRLNPEPYDTMRTEMRDQGTQAYRLQRENISQASDLMKGLAAVTSGTQQGLMQVGMQQAGAEQQIEGINQQISAQEQAGIAQTQNQETLTNYQNKAQAQQFKDQMISAQLARIGDTAGAYSDYVVKKGLAQKMTDLSKEQADKANAIQLAMLKYQAGQNELGSDSFKEAQRQNINQYINETKTNLLNDPRYTSLGPNYDPLTLDQRENKYRMLEQRLGILSDSYDGFSDASKPIEPVKTAEMDDVKWAAVQDDFKRKKYYWERDKLTYDKYKEEIDKTKPVIELERQFQTDLKSAYDISGRRQTFQSDWFKKQGLKTMKEVLDEVEALMNPNRQIFK